MSKSNMSLRERILAKEDRDHQIVHVAQWDEDVKVIGMSARERSKLLRRVTDRESGEVDLELLYPLLVVATCVDPKTDEKIFTEDDIDALADKSGAAMETVGTVASKLSGLDRDEVGELGKPSSPGTNASTETDASPST